MSISPLMIPIIGILVPVSAIVGAFVYVIVKTMAQARVRELEVRERIAMIERGLVPPPEKDPQAFERAMGQYDRYRAHDDEDDWGWRRRRAPGRYRRSGITMIGVGFGLMLLIGVAGESMNAAVGVGGFLVVMGLAFFLNSWFEHRSSASAFSPPPPSAPPPGGTRQPPSFGGNDQSRPP